MSKMNWTFQGEENKRYTVKKEGNRITCDCPNGASGMECTHTRQISRREGDGMKRPTTFNGYSVGDRVTYVGEFEQSKGYFKLGEEGEIINFSPSPKYEWTARVKLGGKEYNFPCKPEYITNKGKVLTIKTDKTQEELREGLWDALMK